MAAGFNWSSYLPALGASVLPRRERLPILLHNQQMRWCLTGMRYAQNAVLRIWFERDRATFREPCRILVERRLSRARFPMGFPFLDKALTCQKQDFGPLAVLLQATRTDL
jgi:hypothetical protein